MDISYQSQEVLNGLGMDIQALLNVHPVIGGQSGHMLLYNSNCRYALTFKSQL